MVIFLIFGITILMNFFMLYVCFLIKYNPKPVEKKANHQKIRSFVMKPLSFYIMIQSTILASSFSQAFFVVRLHSFVCDYVASSDIQILVLIVNLNRPQHALMILRTQ